MGDFISVSNQVAAQRGSNIKAVSGGDSRLPILTVPSLDWFLINISAILSIAEAISFLVISRIL
jgi:hypothetical protein